MPRAPTIVYNDVAVIASQLKAEGIRPTVSLIRDRHGSGSTGTILPLLKKWEAEHEPHIEPSHVLPPSIQSKLLEFISAEVSAAKLSLEVKLRASEGVAVDLARENDRQADAIAAAQDEIAQLRSAVDSTSGRLSRVQAELAEALAQVARERQDAESARTELAKTLLRLEGVPALQQDLASALQATAAERERRVAAEQAGAISATQRDDLQNRIEELKASLAEMKLYGERATESLRLERDETRRLAQAVADLRVSAESAHRDALDARAELARLLDSAPNT